ncbi:MAG: hypothetical protein IJD21_05530 [Oscillospiraceae bacterium]|nr:hypothetical protein [Oscillospiraceae bacterium]
MNETTASFDALTQAQNSLYRQTSQSAQALKDYLSSASQMNLAYAQALGRVRSELSALSNQFRSVAAVGLNAFAGLLHALRPVARGINELVSSLFGVTLKVSEKTGKAADRVTASARSAAAAQKQLFGFDQITRIDSRGASRGGGSSRSGGGTGEVTSQVIRIPGLLTGAMEEIWSVFRGAWEKEGRKVLRSAREAAQSLGQALRSVGRSWLNVWTNGSGERVLRSVLSIAGSLLETTTGLARRFELAWESLGRGEAIFQDLTDLAAAVLSHFEAIASATAGWAAGLDLNGLTEGFRSVTGALVPLTETVGGALSWCYTNVLLPLSKWTIETAAPAALELMASAIRLLTGVLNAFAPIGQSVYQAVLKPLGSWSANLLVAGLTLARQGIQNLTNVFSGMPEKWKAFQEQVSTVWRSFTGNLTESAAGCRTGLLNTFSGITSGISQKLSNLKTVLTTPFKNGLNAVIDLVNRIIGKVNSALKFSWDPVKVMGKTLVPGGSVTLARMPTIPKLADGGLVTGATLAMVGEAGREAVLPLDRETGWMDQLARKLAGAMEDRRGQTVVEVRVGDELLTRQVVRGINRQTRQSGRCPILI